MSYVIFTDSASDLPIGFAAENGIIEVPLRTFMGGIEEQPDMNTFYDRLRNGEVATTSAPNLDDYLSRMEPVLQEGNDILYLAFSSGLSSACRTGSLAAEELSAKYAERKIYVVDTLCASTGLGLLVYLAAGKKAEGTSLEELKDWVAETIPHMCHWFTVDDLMFLKRGGRVSAATAVAGTLMGIKPVMHMDDEGHLVATGKVRGRKIAVQTLLDKMKESAYDLSNQVVAVCHGDCPEEANAIADKMKAELSVKDVLVTKIGPVIGAHAGPGTLSVFFLGEKR